MKSLLQVGQMDPKAYSLASHMFFVLSFAVHFQGPLLFRKVRSQLVHCNGTSKLCSSFPGLVRQHSLSHLPLKLLHLHSLTEKPLH